MDSIICGTESLMLGKRVAELEQQMQVQVGIASELYAYLRAREDKYVVYLMMLQRLLLQHDPKGPQALHEELEYYLSKYKRDAYYLAFAESEKVRNQYRIDYYHAVEQLTTEYHPPTRDMEYQTSAHGQEMAIQCELAQLEIAIYTDALGVCDFSAQSEDEEHYKLLYEHAELQYYCSQYGTQLNEQTVTICNLQQQIEELQQRHAQQTAETSRREQDNIAQTREMLRYSMLAFYQVLAERDERIQFLQTQITRLPASTLLYEVEYSVNLIENLAD